MFNLRRSSVLAHHLVKRCLRQDFVSKSTKAPAGVPLTSPLTHQTLLQRCGQRSFSNQIVDGGQANYKPTPFQQKVLVWTKTYPSEDKIPDRITRSTMKKAMDKFRVKASVYMVALTFVFAAMMAMIGRKARHDGLSVTKIVLARREREKNED